jgi:hypothetical protein
LGEILFFWFNQGLISKTTLIGHGDNSYEYNSRPSFLFESFFNEYTNTVFSRDSVPTEIIEKEVQNIVEDTKIDTEKEKLSSDIVQDTAMNVIQDEAINIIQDNAMQVVHQDEAMQVVHQDEAMQVVHQDDAMQIVHQDDAMQVVHQDDAMQVINQDEAVNIIHHDEAAMPIDAAKLENELIDNPTPVIDPAISAFQGIGDYVEIPGMEKNASGQPTQATSIEQDLLSKINPRMYKPNSN